MNTKYKKVNNNNSIATFYADDGILIFNNVNLFKKITKEFIYFSNLINLLILKNPSF